ncbi:MAG: aminoglycoside phosphotransferase family protein [Planctomycetota bacterium]|nr:aminoglycoside phosphotransferase family protein [Planctomycetota bacterium]
MSEPGDLERIARAFRIPGKWQEAAPHGSGHIHDTWVSTFREGNGQVRYIHQRINRHIFSDPVRLMENIRLVTDHLRAASGAPWRDVLRIVSANDGTDLHRDEAGEHWRTYRFVEGTRSLDRAEGADQVRAAARAFGAFQRVLNDLDPARLHVTIPRFHDLGHRLSQLEEAVKADPAGRASEVGPEISFARDRAWMTDRLARLPLRVSHYDCKLNNILFDEETGECACVVDLDTVMPGLSVHDFGDMLRSMTPSALEDARDASKVRMEIGLFEAVAEGYLSEAGSFLLPAEIDQLAFSGLYMSFIIGVRFLTDHVEGDVYYKKHRSGQNLDRCRSQFRLVESMESQQSEMDSVIKRLGYPSDTSRRPG